MEPKKFITKINMRQLARELGISIMTLYRVLNNEPTVRPATRKRVIDALNKRGYYANQETARKIVVDFSNNHICSFSGPFFFSSFRTTVLRSSRPITGRSGLRFWTP